MTYSESFGISSLMMLTLTLPAIFMIREPSPKLKEGGAPNNPEANDSEAAGAQASLSNPDPDALQAEHNKSCGQIIREVTA